MRRVVSVSLVWSAALAGTALLPALLGVALAVDLVRRVRFATVRAVLFLLLYAWAESIGVVVAAAIGRDAEANYALQRRWAAALGRGAITLYGIRLEVDRPQLLARGPFLLLVRHAAVADVLLPMLLVAVPHHLRPRYVLKRELLWDPCLDIVGHRIPNTFVNRDGTDTAAQLAAVGALGRDLGDRDFVALYPEGTRFTPGRRARALSRLTGADRAWAEGLTQVLPPKSGGVLALLDAVPGADVVVMAHTGLDAGTTLRDLMAGSLVGARWEVSVRRFPRAEIPEGAADRVAWLRARWVEVDGWLATRAVG